MNSVQGFSAGRADQFHPEVLRQARIRRRIAVSDSVARVLAEHAYGYRPESFDNWIALGDVTAAAFENHVGIGRGA